MLASTVQFSNNNPKPTNTTTHPQGKPSEQFDDKASPEKETNNKEANLPAHPLYARPLRTQQRTYGSPPTTSPFQLTPTKEWTASEETITSY